MTQKTDELLDRIEQHIKTVEVKRYSAEYFEKPIPSAEVQRDIAIGIELYQQYIDILDEIKEEVENGEMA